MLRTERMQAQGAREQFGQSDIFDVLQPRQALLRGVSPGLRLRVGPPPVRQGFTVQPMRGEGLRRKPS